jgi:protein SCO1/2
MPLRRSLPVVAAVLLCVLCGALGAPWWRAAEEKSSSSVTAPMIGGPFTLTAVDGSVVTERTYRGKIELIYFGYTYCPDACPTTLNNIAEALSELGSAADHIQGLFITIDSQRDTKEVLADYVRAFDPRIVGLTGTPTQIAEAATAYGVYYAPYKVEGAPDGYAMDHTSVVFVMNEAGRFVATFTPDTPPAQMAERLRKLITKTS